MADLLGIKKRACELVDSMADDLIDVSRRLHAQPELAFTEYLSSKLLAERATLAGMDVTVGAYGLETSFVSEFGQNSSSCIAIISEYDALPNVGHGCGHNVIASIGLGTALTLFGLKAHLPGRVRYLGTPAEERGCGKELMARGGAFDGVDAAMMVHPFHVHSKAMRAMYIGEVKVVYTGRAGHALLGPETARNALDAVVISYQAVGSLRQHLKKGESINGVLPSAGSAPNVFPVVTEGHYFVRTQTEDDLAALKKRVEDCFHAGAQASGCSVDIRWSNADYLPMNVNLPLADAYEANGSALGFDFTDYMQLPIAGTDMGNVSQRVPVLHALLKCAPPEATLHTPDFASCMNSKMGDQAVIEGAKALSMTAIDFLFDEKLRARVRVAQSGMTSHHQVDRKQQQKL